jgi:3-deoxy-manno-octulosonate cytidylyltransferase (CMP-KDO synthetase)
MNDFCILIPSRIGSTRLPNKPLADICGKTMIGRVIDQAKKTGCNNIVVCTDSDEILAISQNCGVKAILTDPSLPSGSDRIYKAYYGLGIDCEFIINLQGDMPNIDPEIIINTYRMLKRNKDCDIATTVFEISRPEEINNPNIVKAVLSIKPNEFQEHRAIYFTRSIAPYTKNNDVFYHHVGIYGYRRDALKKFVELEPSYLEKRESLEQLRALENDMKIYAKIINKMPISVDTADDLEIARNYFLNL